MRAMTEKERQQRAKAEQEWEESMKVKRDKEKRDRSARVEEWERAKLTQIKEQEESLMRHNQLLKDVQEVEKTLTSKREMINKFEQKMAQLEVQRVEMEARLAELKHSVIPSPPSPLTPQQQGENVVESGGWSP